MSAYHGDLTIIDRLREPLPSLNRIGQDRRDAADEIARGRRERDLALDRVWQYVQERNAARRERDALARQIAILTDALDAARQERDAARRERDALALQVLTLTNERDEARALGRIA